jgi:L,D-peptidoglycan transpeptidase YkuD (ErfK/YbiS/YcfS/YnhG family)
MDRERRRRDARRRVVRQRIVAGVLAGLLVLIAIVVLARRSGPDASTASPPSEVSQLSQQGSSPSPSQAPADAPSPTPAEAAATPVPTPTTAEPTPTKVEPTPTEAEPAPAPEEVTATPTPAAGRAAGEGTTLPDRMARMLPGSRQIIVITGERLGSRSGRLRVFDRTGDGWVQVMDVPAAFGAKGLVDGLKRTAGHLQTPTGIWRIGSFLFGQHATPPVGTRMPYRHIRQDSWWSDERDTYNTWVTSRTPIDGEHLADARVQYEYAFDSGYNAPPNEVVIGRGTAIFIHCSEPPGNSLGKFTHGCVAVDRTAMKRLFRLLTPARRPTCAIGTLQKGSSTSIWAY